MDPVTDNHHKYCCGNFKPDDVVISGISGRFPECRSVKEFMKVIHEKKKILLKTDKRYLKGAYKNCDLPVGAIPDIDKFDADFFSVDGESANRLDPSTRIHLEVVYEAIFDSGYDPAELRGRNVGVYNAQTADDNARLQARNQEDTAVGYNRCVSANRTSYYLGITGPSYSIDTACSSSNAALHCAFCDIRAGHVDAAIVTATQINLNPVNAHSYTTAGISKDEKCSIPFDARSTGMVRAEAVSAIFLQRAGEARRVYATVASSQYYSSATVPEGISVPSGKMQVKLGRSILEEAGIEPEDIVYIEAHGTGTLVGDPIELNSAAEIYLRNRNRKEPLYIGSIKSTVGHTEASSGICGVLNAIFAFESGMMSPNRCYTTPNTKCGELLNGQIIVPKDLTPFSKEYIPVSSFGLGGTLAAVVLKRNPIAYSGDKKRSDLPRLVLFPSTTESGVAHALDYVRQNYDTLPEEFFALINKLSFTPPCDKSVRGYSLLSDPQNPVSHIKTSVPNNRPIWFVMTGMECQWPGMGLQLMRIDVFEKSLKKSAEVLKDLGIDLFEFLKADKNYLLINKWITPAFVTITSIQIALVDLLINLGIKPDGIIGHSTGEIACAYADGCLSSKEALLVAYYSGKAVEDSESKLVGEAMAAVGLSWEKAQAMCPKGIYLVCNYSEDSVMLSGLKETLEKFIAKLQSVNIPARIVDSYGFGFHCEYVNAVSVPLRSFIKKLLTDPKPRSERWLSSSYPVEEWEQSKMADAEYFVHNLTSAVRFHEVVKMIPKDAITIEIGPKSMLQSLLKASIGPDAAYIGLMAREDGDDVKFLFESLGKLYTEGADPMIERLYPPVEFPLPRGTPFLSNLIKWDHSASYKVPQYLPTKGSHRVEFNTDREDAYLLDHYIDGRFLFPATGYIYVAWEALAAIKRKPMNECPVIFRDFKIHRATFLIENENACFYCSIVEGSGFFEISEGKSLVASGYVYEGKDMVFAEEEPTYECDRDSWVSGKDLYNELKMSGYEYGPAFQSLLEMNLEGTNALALWNERWIPFLDLLLTFLVILKVNGELLLPTGMTIKIDPMVFRKYLVGHYTEGDARGREEELNGKPGNNKLKEMQPKDSIPVSYNPFSKTVRTPGVELQELMMDSVKPRGKKENLTTERYEWIPYISHYTPNDEDQQQLTYYMGVCNKIIDDIRRLSETNVSYKKFPIDGAGESNIEDFLGNLSENHQLLKVLSEISENVANIPIKKEEWLSSYQDTIGMEILNNTLLNDETMRIMLELITENTFKNLSLMEVNNGFPLVSPFLLETAAKVTTTKFKQASLVLNKEREINTELLTKNSIELISQADLSRFTTPEGQQDLITSSFTTGTKDDLKKMVGSWSSICKANGFILLFHKGQLLPAEKFVFELCGAEIQVQSQCVLEEILRSCNLVILSKIADPFGGSVYLIRQAAAEERDKIIKVSKNGFSWVDDIKRELYGDGESAHRLWIVSDDNHTSGVVGMVNCLKQEPRGERVRCVFISYNNNEGQLPEFNLEEPIYKELRDRNLVMNVWRDDAWGCYRHINIKKHKVPRDCLNSYINCRKYGDLSSFEWIESPLKYQNTKDKSVVQIYYSALNFKDVMLATGRISEGMGKFRSNEDDGVDDCILGFEFSGRDTNGRRVCGLVRSGGFATSVATKPEVLYEIPDHWTLEEAATVTSVYSTCIYALFMRAKLKRGESILIHSGTGGVGLAAIRLALSLDCEIFTTVGTDEKREYILKNFPQIKPENIGSSRNVSFEEMIMTRTNRRGVDVVLNSLADDKFMASIRCVARGGRFVEIGKYDLSLDRKIGTRMFLDNITFHGVCLDVAFGNARKMANIMDRLADAIKSGVVQPLDRKVFEKDEVEDAFRYMTKGVHIGKVLLKIRDEEPCKVVVPKPLVQQAVPTTYFYRDKVYIIIGGLGGLGVEITKWMIRKGARHIILTSRYGVRTPYHNLRLQRWIKEGADVRVSTLNVGIRKEAEQLIKEASSIAPVGGFFNSAVVLKDAFFDSQTPESFKEVCESKAFASMYLDELTREMCPEIDYFVCFSSMSCGRGNAGQTNYGFANSVMERICEQRRRAGLHGLAVQWGVIGQVGVVHRHMGDDAKIAGLIAQTVKSCVNVLDAFLQQDGAVVSSYVTSMETKKSEKGDILNQIAKVLGVNSVSEIYSTRSFGEMGLDSMVGVELKQVIESHCDVRLSMQETQDLKIGDVLAMAEKAADCKKVVASSMIATAHINLPDPLLPKETVEVLHEAVSGTPTFILSIGDSGIGRLRVLAKTIGGPVYALRWTKDTPSVDIKSAASHFLDVIRITSSGAFNLVSNDISANLALEMAIRSEKSDERVKSLTQLYGSADLVNTMNKDDVKSKDADVEKLRQFAEQFMLGCFARLDEELRNHSNLDQRINTIVNFITSSSSQAINRLEVSEAVNEFIKKRNLTESYSTNEKLSMNIHLFEDSNKVLSNDITVIKEAFEQVASGKVEVYRMCGYQQLENIEDAARIGEVMKTYFKS